MKDYIDSLLQEIKEDRTTGAGELVKKGANIVAQFITNFNGEPVLLFNELTRISQKLVDCQPSMAPFFHLANIILLSAKGHKDLEKMKGETTGAMRRFVLRLQDSAEQIAKIARELIPERSRVLTHSYSSTVLMTLADAKRVGKQFEVICTESRPICEGFQMAKKLGESKIKVQLQIDSAAAYAIKDADLVLVGADCITPLGLVNKVGTYGLALSAKGRRVPFYVLCGTEKLLGAEMAKGFRILKRDPKEVWPDPPKEVEVLNFYFDNTPLSLLTAIVTEEGMIPESKIAQRFQRIKVSNHFPM
jgi:translation initiation factor 2B subunit (eIF-2B alpha/beta/delta family)